MHRPIPISDKFRIPKILLSVPVRPMNSAPRLSRKIFLEKKARNKLMI